MRKASILTLLAISTFSPTKAQVSPVSPPPAPTIQQQFDAGTAASDAQDWAKALTIYTALETRLASSKTPRSLAIVRLRKGTLLFRFKRIDESETAILAALEKLPADDASLREDRAQGLFALADIAESRYDYAGSVAQFRAALATSDSTNWKVITLSRMVAIGIFVDPEQALADSDTLLAVIGKEADAKPAWLGVAHNLRGRVLLNQGRFAEAKTEIDLAIKLFGGNGYGKIDFNDVAARSDAAITAIKLGDRKLARDYLSRAGAAMQSDQGFALGKDMGPPACGGADGPKPDDVAVIELQIAEDGSVNYARPIYFSGKPQAALDFAKQVSTWSWSADELKQVQAFFRLQTRIEMRCTTVFNRPSPITMLLPSMEKWTVAKSLEDKISTQLPDAKALARDKALLTQLTTSDGATSLKLLPVLYRMRFNSVLPLKESVAISEQSLKIVRAASAPAPVIALFELDRANLLNGFVSKPWSAKLQQSMDALLNDPVISGNLEANGAVSVTYFDQLPITERKTKGRALLRAVIDDKTRSANDPFRVAALIRMANLEFDSGNADAARAAYAETGLSGQQCALVDAQPRQTGGTIRDADYPNDALMAGFSGWTVTEFDIAADGATLNQRALISFPPFIFGDPTAARIKTFRYEQSYRPAGGLGCGGQRQRVTYRRAGI